MCLMVKNVIEVNEMYKCEHCAETFESEIQYEYTMDLYGKSLCFDCESVLETFLNIPAVELSAINDA